MAKKKPEEKPEQKQAVTISPPKMTTVKLRIIGEAPYVGNKFSAKALEAMKKTQSKDKQKGKAKDLKARDFAEEYQGRLHFEKNGGAPKYGIPTTAIRSSLIDACRLANFKMTFAKICIFVEADGYDSQSGDGLAFFTKGEPRPFDSSVVIGGFNGSAAPMTRPMWDPGWEVDVRIKFDSDQFSVEDVINLMDRAVQQVGWGAGRPNSKKSNGMGWGTGRIDRETEPEVVNHF